MITENHLTAMTPHIIMIMCVSSIPIQNTIVSLAILSPTKYTKPMCSTRVVACAKYSMYLDLDRDSYLYTS